MVFLWPWYLKDLHALDSHSLWKCSITALLYTVLEISHASLIFLPCKLFHFFFGLEGLRNFPSPLKSESITRIYLRLDCCWSVFPSTQTALSLCRFRPSLLSGNFPLIAALHISSVPVFCFPPPWTPALYVLFLLCLRFSSATFPLTLFTFLLFSFSCLSPSLSSMSFVTFHLDVSPLSILKINLWDNFIIFFHCFPEHNKSFSFLHILFKISDSKIFFLISSNAWRY